VYQYALVYWQKGTLPAAVTKQSSTDAVLRQDLDDLLAWLRRTTSGVLKVEIEITKVPHEA
jgi:hypothetical protein